MKQRLIQQVKNKLEQRRQKAEAELEQRRKAVYATIPMLAELDSLQTLAGGAAANYSMAGDKAMADEKLAQIKDITSRKELLLRQNGFDANILKPQYSCSICGDKGYVGGQMCACMKQELNNLRRENIHKSGALKLTTFDTFLLDAYPESMEGINISPRRVMAKVLDGCRDYANDFGRNSPSLFLFGDAGLGKTHLALAIAAQVLDKGYDVIYVSSQAAMSQITSARYGDDGGLFRTMVNAELLVLDDLGTECIDAYMLSKIYELVNSRLGKPTIYTSNICSQERLHQRYTEKVASRLMGECQLMRLWGNDIRLQGKM